MMRIPRRNGEAVIVLGGRSGAFSFGFWVTMGAVAALGSGLMLHRWARLGWQALTAWWGA